MSGDGSGESGGLVRRQVQGEVESETEATSRINEWMSVFKVRE